MKSSWVVTRLTLGNFFYMQISAAIIEKPILFNIAENIHDYVTQIVSIPMLSWSLIKIDTIRK